MVERLLHLHRAKRKGLTQGCVSIDTVRAQAHIGLTVNQAMLRGSSESRRSETDIAEHCLALPPWTPIALRPTLDSHSSAAHLGLKAAVCASEGVLQAPAEGVGHGVEGGRDGQPWRPSRRGGGGSSSSVQGGAACP